MRQRILAGCGRRCRGAGLRCRDAAGPDPGFKLVVEAAEAGHRIQSPARPLGPARRAGGGRPAHGSLPVDGFLPPKDGQRRNRIAELKTPFPSTLVLYETGPRLPESLADLAEGLGPRARRHVPRTYQGVRGGAARNAGDAGGPLCRSRRPKGEIVLVIGPPQDEVVEDTERGFRPHRALADHSLKDAVAPSRALPGVPSGRSMPGAGPDAGEDG